MPAAARTSSTHHWERFHHRPGCADNRLLALLTAWMMVIAATVSVLVAAPVAAATATAVGAGSYATDVAGPLPSGCGDLSTDPREFVTANAPAGAVPTNDWWSSLIFKRLNCQYSENLEAHPAVYLPAAGGLGFAYPTTPQITAPAPGLQEYHYVYSQDFIAGMPAMSAPVVKVDGWSDWTVTPSWSDGTRGMTATIGHGLPMTYFKVTGGGAALTPNATPRIWQNDGATVGFTINGHDYAAYAPTGATWNTAGPSFTSTLAGKNYYTVAVLPTTTASPDSDRLALAAQFGRYAYATVTGTTLSYRYDEPSSTVIATYGFTTKPSEGSETKTVTALYQHQWKSLIGATPIAAQYVSPRGPMKILVGVQSFTTSMIFHGVLPELPAVADGSGTDGAALAGYLGDVAADPMALQKSDTYWTGKGLGRAARIAEVADQVGDTGTRDAALGAIRSTLTDWFTASPGKTSQLFYYNKNWGTLIGYPASYGSDSELNDHHFHYGYFIAAAATLARFDPAWAATGQYGGMVDLLIRDANNYDRTDTRFPYLRDFDIFAGHDWASGHAAFAAGNNQESSSEGMNFANALIQWGQVTGNTAIRDAGIFIYTTQAEAIQQYWFDVDGTTFPAGWQQSAVGMVWGDGGSYATWFSPDPEKIQGINMLPITGGHLYLGYHPDYVKKNYQQIVASSAGAPHEWQDVIWSFLATGDPDAALALYRANNSFVPEEGESRAHTFHWIRNLAALGVIDTSVTADSPLAVTFIKNGVRTYVASNVTATTTTVTFSTGVKIVVAPGKTATTGALTFSGGAGQGGGGANSSVPPTEPTPTVVPPTSASPTVQSPTVLSSTSVSSLAVSPTVASLTATPPTVASPTNQSSAKFSPLRYLGTAGNLTDQPGSGRAVVLHSADGGTRDGLPYQASVFSAGGLTATYQGGQTAFALAVDSGQAVGNAVQIRISYDFTGDGSWDRVETYRYFATDPVVGAENYSQQVGLASQSGGYGNLVGGKVRVDIWSAISGTGGTSTVAGTSSIRLPFS